LYGGWKLYVYDYCTPIKLDTFVSIVPLGTVFLEVWKRTNATLAYEWDVDSFESTETDRPEFIGTREIPVCIVILLITFTFEYELYFNKISCDN